MNPKDKELLGLYNSLSIEDASKLSEDEMNDYERLINLSKSETKSSATETKPSISQDQYKLLQQNVGNYGYSGLDEAQKKLFRDQFPQSKFAKAGGSFEDAVKYVDSNSSYNSGRGLLDTHVNEGDVNTSNMGDNTTFTGAAKNAWQGVKDVGNMVKEHPGTAALTLASGIFPELIPLTTGGVVRAGLAGSVARAIDKQHPFTNEMPDYRNEKPIESATDILGAGAGSALGQLGTIGLVKGVGAIASPMIKRDADIAEAIEKNRLSNEAVDVQNMTAQQAVDAQNAKIALQNQNNAEYLKLLRNEGLTDPNFKLESLRRRMMAEQPDVSGAFAGGQTENEFFNALAEARRVGDYRFLPKSAQEYLAAKRVAEPSFNAENLKPSDWDVAQKMAELKRGIPNVEYPEPIPYPQGKSIPPRLGVDVLQGVPGAGVLHDWLVSANYPGISPLVRSFDLRNNMGIPELAKTIAVPVEGSSNTMLGNAFTPFTTAGGERMAGNVDEIAKGYKDFMKWKKETGEDISTVRDAVKSLRPSK